MPDIQVIVQRPVAFPAKFLLSPQEPSLFFLMACGFGAMSMFIFRDLAMWGILCLFLWVPIHAALMALGIKEPHLWSITQTWMNTYLTPTKTPRSIGNRGRTSRFFHAA